MYDEHEDLRQREEWETKEERTERDYEVSGYDAECEVRDFIGSNEFKNECDRQMNPNHEEKTMEQITTRGEEKLEVFRQPVQSPTQIVPATRMSLEEAKTRFNEVRSFCKEILKSGIDFGTIPGTGKPSLWKPGAEKILMFLMLRPEFIPIKVIEDFDKPLFFYRYRCELYHIGTGHLVCSGIGSCSSMEQNYRWRTAKRVCPKCGSEVRQSNKPSERTGKPGFYCWQKTGGCGENFHSDDPEILDQKLGQVLNEHLCDQINTIDKIAQKRSMLAPTLIVSGLSDEFTQDTEDMPKDTFKDQDKQAEKKSKPPVNKTQPPAANSVATQRMDAAKLEIAEVCEQLVTKGIYKDVRLALMEIMNNPEVTFDHIQAVSTHPKHLKVVAAIEKGKQLLKPSN